MKSFSGFLFIFLYLFSNLIIFPVNVFALSQDNSSVSPEVSFISKSSITENYKTYPIHPDRMQHLLLRERTHLHSEDNTLTINPYQRKLFLNPFAYHNKRIDYYVKYFQNEARDHFEIWLDRASKYLAITKNIFREYGLPDDLAYLAMIESGFNPKAYSRAKATGMWQFMAGTAKLYNLRIDWWIDERRDPVKSSHAAARHLRDLYEQFDSWPLAIAAYNSGKGRISRATKKYNSNDIWVITRKRYLPRETKNYFPKFIAALRILKRPSLYGFEDIKSTGSFKYDEVSVPFATDLKVIAEASNSDVASIKALNPELRRWFTPPNYPSYQVKIPYGTKETYLANISRIPLDDRIVFLKHKIRRGETLSHISKRYRTSTKAIMYLNNINNPRRVRAGKVLVVPMRGEKIRIRKAVNTKHQTMLAASSDNRVMYTVRKGDNIWDIANSFGIRADLIYRWNGIDQKSFIFPGDELVIYLKK